MINIQKIDHIGIRICDKHISIPFYEMLGFKLIVDIGFEEGHPIMMEHPSGVVLNLLGPGIINENKNILMDVEDKYAGYTHMALKIENLKETEAYFQEKNIDITGRFSFKGMNAIFIRDPDLNVIEFDEYSGTEPGSRSDAKAKDSNYKDHP